jgi:hypothetical protein
MRRASERIEEIKRSKPAATLEVLYSQSFPLLPRLSSWLLFSAWQSGAPKGRNKGWSIDLAVATVLVFSYALVANLVVAGKGF